jgi:hypothetical protein
MVRSMRENTLRMKKAASGAKCTRMEITTLESIPKIKSMDSGVFTGLVCVNLLVLPTKNKKLSTTRVIGGVDYPTVKAGIRKTMVLN